ncbi:tetratricopeptide repeat protein [Caedibacter taeniospiralis]|jgi:TPR repeat protein|uniref:tetratricopeptide repeat protein n=1 Tax=Caedibacter taeniospiralis TaxID=28907 RepID=UPI0037C006A6
MNFVKKYWSLWVVFIVLLFAIGLLSMFFYYPPTHAAITSTPQKNPKNIVREAHENNKTNYTDLSPEAAYNKGVEYTKQANNLKTYNINTAVDYIQYSAATGYAEAQFKLGLMYFQGLGVQSNPAVGFYWIEKAAKNDYPEAQIYLAYMYKKGIGVPTDIFKSNYWLRQARTNGINLSIDTLSFF